LLIPVPHIHVRVVEEIVDPKSQVPIAPKQFLLEGKLGARKAIDAALRRNVAGGTVELAKFQLQATHKWGACWRGAGSDSPRS
jgi:hypothetical protein